MDNYRELWDNILEYCKKYTTETAFNLWFQSIRIKEFTGKSVTLEFKSEYFKSTFVKMYDNLIHDAFAEVCGIKLDVDYCSVEDETVKSEKKESNLEDFKNEIYTFDNFIVGPSIRFAHAAAKAIAAGVPYEGDFWDFYIGKAKVKKALKVGVVLTIPAAGSEGSGNTVNTKQEGLQKLSLRVPELLRPVFAVMNPELTYTLPPYQTACGIADMMVHIMERYFTNTPDVEISDRLCEGTLMAIIKEAYKVKQNPNDYEARANIMWCGTIAHNGTCGVGCEEDWASHFLEHEISAVYNVTHGAGLAVIVPAWMTFMAEHNPKKIARFANRVFGVPENEDLEEMALAGISRLKHFFRYMGLPVNFKELGIEHPDIELLVKKLHENKGELVGNYVKLNKEYSKEIFELACK